MNAIATCQRDPICGNMFDTTSGAETLHPTHALLRSPPVSQDGRCHYIAAAFDASPEDARTARTIVRGRPIAVLHRNNRMDVVMLLAKPVEAADGLRMADRLAAAFAFPCTAVAPSPVSAPQWSAPRMTVRDRIRIDLAVGGSVDVMALPLASPVWEDVRACYVYNNAGTRTYVGAGL